MTAPLLPGWLLTVLLTGILILSVGIEWRRPVRFKALRMVTSVAIVASIGFILLRPLTAIPSDDQIVLLTEGYDAGVADSLGRVLRRPKFYQLEGNTYRHAVPLRSYRNLLPGSGTRDGKVLRDAGHGIEAFLEGQDALSSGKFIGMPTVILGDGLPAYALDSISTGFTYYPSKTREGITGLVPLQRVIARHNTSTISGNYHTTHLPATLYVSDPGGKFDSLQITEEYGSFTFRFSPRTSGRLTYSVLLRDSLGNSIAEEHIPVDVDRFRPLNILFLQDYPTFEVQYLKNYLADRGHRVALRTQFSKTSFRTEFINRNSVSLGKLTLSLLKEFDLLVVDPLVISRLPVSERTEVEQAVRNGLGILQVFGDTPGKRLHHPLLPVKFNPAQADTTGLSVNDRHYLLPAARLLPIGFQGNAVSVNNTRILSGFLQVGAGTSGFQLLQQTYSLLLAGDSVAYGSVWTPLIDGTARRSSLPGMINISSEFPLPVNEPIAINVISETTPDLYADGVHIPVREDVIIDGLWHATVWVDQAGWHQLTTPADTTAFYTFDSTAWQALRVEQKHKINQKASLAPASPAHEGPVIAPVSMMPFWILLVLSLGFLWLAPRL